MNPFEILLIIFCCLFLLTIVSLLVGIFVLDHRYKKFYQNTEEGHLLYKLLEQKSEIQHNYDLWSARISSLEAMIDKRSNYYPQDALNDIELVELRKEYSNIIIYLEKLLVAFGNIENLINTLVASLPKKYKDILDYNYRCAELNLEDLY